LRFNDSLIVEGDMSGIAMRSRKHLECGGLTPPFKRKLIALLLHKGGVKPLHSKAPC
jgi:hypothetical protein